MDLTSIKQTAQEIAVSISKVVGVDVLIVDENLERIADTFRYPYNDSLDIHSQSIIGRIIKNERPLVIDNKDYFQSCVDCHNYTRCKMEGLIGVPILYQGRAIGAIGLAVEKRNASRLMENVTPILTFLQQMADLLSDKLSSQASYASLQSISSQWAYILGTVDSGVALSDENGVVIVHNERFLRCFQIEGPCAGRSLTDLIPHPLIREILTERQDVADRTIALPLPYSVFYGHIRVKQMWQEGVYRGAVFSFQDLYDLLPDDLLFFQGAYSGETIRQLCPGETGHRLEALAKTGRPLLLCGGSQQHLLRLAAAVHAASGQKGRFVAMRDLSFLESEPFSAQDSDTPSNIFLAHQGTLCLCDVFDLPLYMQRQIAAYLQTPPSARQKTAFSTQLIFLSGMDIRPSPFVDRSLFQALQTCRIDIPDPFFLRPRQQIAMLERCIARYAACYRKSVPTIEDAARDRLLDFPWEQKTFHKAVEHLVDTCDGVITDAQVQQLLAQMGPVSQSLESFEEQEIRRLAAEGVPYGQIAHILKISRSTVYRRVKKYQL